MHKKQFSAVTDDDSELWARLRQGDAVAYTRLMHLYANTMFRYALRLSPDEDMIKDCIQDVFCELWNKRNRISQTQHVKAYLLKSLRLRMYAELPKWNYAECINDDYHFTVEYNIESRMVADEAMREDYQKLEKVLNRLPHRQKEILYLRFYENFDQHRIAEVMGLNRQSVYNLLNDALNALRKHWFRDLVISLLLFFAAMRL